MYRFIKVKIMEILKSQSHVKARNLPEDKQQSQHESLLLSQQRKQYRKSKNRLFTLQNIKIYHRLQHSNYLLQGNTGKIPFVFCVETSCLALAKKEAFYMLEYILPHRYLRIASFRKQ